jgi:hypothetical protein
VEVTITLRHDPGSVRIARAGAGALCDGGPERVRDAQLLVSELVTNAIEHGKPDDARAEAGVAAELGWARRAADVADLGGDREGQDPADSRR